MKRICNILIVSMMALIMSSCNKDNDKTISPQFVDLGLSVKWATFNMGASAPEEYGDYYAWGETETKLKYFWTTYKFNKGSDDDVQLTKYCTDSDNGYNGFSDDILILESDDDVAHIKWGGNWRMPSKAEFEELLDTVHNTTIINDTVNQVIGIRISSKLDGFTNNSIFFPLAGYKGGSNPISSGKSGHYWSNTLNSYSPTNSLDFSFKSGTDFELSTIGTRYVGYSVRPVCP